MIPPSPAVAKGDTIAWRNYTHGNIEVLLTSVFPGVKGVPAANGDVDVIVNANAPAGFYPYAVYAAEANDRAENIGARRLHTILEALLEDLCFRASELTETEVHIDAERVRATLAPILASDDLAKYIL